ncbi:MAG: tRNA (adenosine(37)-N6)-dimethylallyltransferase MiaA [Rickettsiales bacterium]
MKTKNAVHIITGPTGSGKTARALQAAAEKNGIIINADAMQTYADLRILSARPTEEEENQAEHRLYGVLDVFDPCTAARWVDMAAKEIRQVWQENKLPILVGGTGMYIKSLMQGLSDIPDIPAEIRERVRAMPEPYIYLQQIDPEMAARLKPGDSQRIARALEVMEATGISLAEWQAKPMKPALPEADYTMEIIALPRDELYHRIDRRLDLMIDAGALEEVEVLWKKVRDFSRQSPLPIREEIKDLSATYPLLRAHGVPEFFAYLDGTMKLREAIDKAKQNTRNYAKRQMTWIRNQFTLPNR